MANITFHHSIIHETNLCFINFLLHKKFYKLYLTSSDTTVKLLNKILQITV